MFNGIKSINFVYLAEFIKFNVQQVCGIVYIYELVQTQMARKREKLQFSKLGKAQYSKSLLQATVVGFPWLHMPQ